MGLRRSGVMMAGVRLERWERLLEETNDARMWAAVDWNGCLKNNMNDSNQVPSDEEFQQHFSELFEGSEGGNLTEVLEGHNVNIPVLDDNITADERQQEMRNLKN